MTTKIIITCQENSHWDIAVITQDQEYDFKSQTHTDKWNNVGEPKILGPGESTEKDHMYVHSSRRFVVEERVRK